MNVRCYIIANQSRFGDVNQQAFVVFFRENLSADVFVYYFNLNANHRYNATEFFFFEICRRRNGSVAFSRR